MALFAEAWATLAWMDFEIRAIPYRRWRHWLQPGSGGRVSPRDSRRLATAVERAARRHHHSMNCLRRSLALCRLLQRRGMEARLHFGVRTAQEGLEAHAWVSSGGEVLNDRPDVTERYRELKAEEMADGVVGGLVKR